MNPTSSPTLEEEDACAVLEKPERNIEITEAVKGVPLIRVTRKSLTEEKFRKIIDGMPNDCQHVAMDFFHHMRSWQATSGNSSETLSRLILMLKAACSHDQSELQATKNELELVLTSLSTEARINTPAVFGSRKSLEEWVGGATGDIHLAISFVDAAIREFKRKTRAHESTPDSVIMLAWTLPAYEEWRQGKLKPFVCKRYGGNWTFTHQSSLGKEEDEKSDAPNEHESPGKRYASSSVSSQRSKALSKLRQAREHLAQLETNSTLAEDHHVLRRAPQRTALRLDVEQFRKEVARLEEEAGV